MLFTREGWIIAGAASLVGASAFMWASWPWWLVGAAIGFALFTAFAYLRG
jgi:hypothetical protein